MQDKTLVDTCVLVYLVDKAENAKHEKAARWFESIKGEKDYFVSMQNLREFANIALIKTSLPALEINETIGLFSEAFCLICDSREDIAAAINAAESNRKNYWDALLAATMQRHGINRILTENTRHFEKFRGINAINPFK